MKTAAKGYAWGIALGVLAAPALAENGGWQKLTGSEIEAALDGKTLKYATATQVFYKSGRTLYDAGRPSWGYWRIQGDDYCSQWPPNAGWECYGFERRVGETGDEVEIRFVSKSGHATNGIYME